MNLNRTLALALTLTLLGLELPGCEQQLHLPFFKFGEVPYPYPYP